MSKPTFFNEGHSPRRRDTKWKVAQKWLGAIQDEGGSNPDNDPSRNDSMRRILDKIERAKSGN